MTLRYYCPKIDFVAKKALLDGDEAKHLSKVMRKKSGDEVQLFDGSGVEFLAVIDAVNRNDIELSIRSSWKDSKESDTELVVASALPKGDRQKWLVEKLTELGCICFIPLSTDYRVAKGEPHVTERLRRTVIESSKQCGRSRLMRIAEEMSFAQLTDEISRRRQADPKLRVSVLIPHPVPHGNVGQIPLGEWIVANRSKTDLIYVLIGPEGGFSPTEIEQAVADNWIAIDLGARILRTETAAISACATILAFVP